MRSLFLSQTIGILLCWLLHATTSQNSKNKNNRQLSECELKCHSSFTASEREQLCRGTHKGNLIGPALCSAEAKSKLSVKFDVILQLCKGATSIFPVKCYQSLSSGDRNKYGVELCTRTTTELPNKCWAEMRKFTGQNKVKDFDLLSFCKEIEDMAPILCVQAAVASQLSTAPAALQPCLNATLDESGETVVPYCIDRIKRQVNPSRGFNPVDIIDFCAKAAINGTVDCFEASSTGLGTPPLSMTPLDRSRLCESASGSGPVDCALASIQLELRLRSDSVVALCSGAESGGPARCFKESRGVGPEAVGVALCNGASSAGPVQCFRRAQTVFRGDEKRQRTLCTGAESEDPAICAYNAPYYLSADEKINLCHDAVPSRGQDPLKCLQLVEGPSHHFSKAPSKGLGYMLDTLTVRADRVSRELLINMCSFSYSVAPITSAKCLKATSFALDHDDAVRMCTNATSEESSRQQSVCTRMLPRDWQSAESSLLCSSVATSADADGVVKCAVEVMHQLRLSKLLAAELCRQDTKKNAVLDCALAAVPYPGASTGVDSVKGVTSDILINVCGSANSTEPGACLAKVYTHSTLQYEQGASEALCKSKDALAKLGCVSSLRKQYVSLEDVEGCVGETRVVSSVKVIYFVSEDYKQEATSGKIFSLRFQLFDQWNQKLEFSSIEEELTLSASINENNPQGAVLWGIRSNVTRKGVLELNRLMISQPGKVAFKIAANRGVDSVAIFSLDVKEDPATRNTAMCASFFRVLSTSIDTRESQWVSYFPRTKGYVESSMLFDALFCMDTFSKWHVNAIPHPSGTVWFDYKTGIDAIWTGINLPRMEQPFEVRLDVTSVAKIKDVRRAYYKKSLQWHPDRWAGMPIYGLVVQGAFELINEAYEGLTAGLSKSE